jgi:peptide/nickel transport system permease protein
MSTAWWWSLPPGIMLSLTVISAFMFSRGYERASSGTERETLREA